MVDESKTRVLGEGIAPKDTIAHQKAEARADRSAAATAARPAPEPEEQWEDVTGSLHSWKDAKPGMMLQGEYLGAEERPNLNGDGTQNLYTLRTAQGITSFFGTTVLNTIMQRVPMGAYVRITYTGDKEHTERGMSAIKQFGVQIRKNAETAVAVSRRSRRPMGGDASADDAVPF